MRKAQFKIESLGYEIFDGFTRDEDWNGWACPYFIFEQAQEVVKQYNLLRQIIGQPGFAFHEKNADIFVFPSDDFEPEIFAAIKEEDQKYYPIGAFCWIWEEITT